MFASPAAVKVVGAAKGDVNRGQCFRWGEGWAIGRLELWNLEPELFGEKIW